jgi:hypothetical protein
LQRFFRWLQEGKMGWQLLLVLPKRWQAAMKDTGSNFNAQNPTDMALANNQGMAASFSNPIAERMLPLFKQLQGDGGLSSGV